MGADGRPPASASREESPPPPMAHRAAEVHRARGERERLGEDEHVLQEPLSFFVSEAGGAVALQGHSFTSEARALETGHAREPFITDEAQEAQREERTGFWTHYLCHLVRVTFLLSHGVMVMSVSSALADVGEASWFLLFTPAWIGDSLCLGLLAYSWFASCPYIKRCHREGKVKIGAYPSFLTELLPEIVFSVLSFLFLLFVILAEYELCSYLKSLKSGTPSHVVSTTVFLCIVAFFAVCHGMLLTHNSPLYIAVGGSTLLSVILFLAVRSQGPEVQAWLIAPPFLGVLLVSLAGLLRLCSHCRLLAGQEQGLRFLEVVLLLSMLPALWLIAQQIQADEVHEAGANVMFVGGVLSAVALLRGRLYWWEARSGTLLERAIEEMAVPAEGVFEEDDMAYNDEEIQLAAQHLAGPVSL